MEKFSSVKEMLFGTQAQRDLWWLVLFCLFVFAMAEEVNFFESLHEFTRAHEDWDLDEYFSVAIFLPIACLVYIGRRYQELQQEVELRRQAEEAVRRLANYDFLTGLPNRNLLEDRLAQAIARAKRRRTKLAVFFIDLDGFKAVNDIHGHAVGDDLLRELAGRIRKQVREPDTAVRLGGDEFLVLLDEVGANGHIAEIAQRLIAEISMPCRISGADISVSASIGISIFSGSDPGAGQQLIPHADQAMYQAKLKGKSQYVFFAEPPAGSRGQDRIGDLTANAPTAGAGV